MYNPVVTRLEQAEAKFAEAKAEFVETFNDSPSYATEWKLKGVLEAQALVEVAALLADEGEGITAEAVAAWADEFGRRGLASLRIGESRSTSAATNLSEDIRQARKLELYVEYREFAESQARVERARAERAERMRRVGARVLTSSRPERQYVCIVTHVHEDGRVDLAMPTGSQTAVLTFEVEVEGLRETDVDPYRAVQTLFERKMDRGQAAAQIEEVLANA